MKDRKQIAVPTLTQLELVAGGWVKKYVLHLKDASGREFTYDAVSRKEPEEFSAELKREIDTPPTPDAIAIVGITEADEVLLIKEYRYPLGQWCSSFPAGLIDKEENPLQAVERELAEETGFKLVYKEGKPVHRFVNQPAYSSNGMTEESILTVFALVERSGEAAPEIHEYIEPFLLPLKDVRDFLDNDPTPIGARCQFVLEGLACGARFI